MMKKLISILLSVIICVALSACGQGVVLDENEVIIGNGTGTVIKNNDTYTIDGEWIIVDEIGGLCTIGSSTDGKIFALGEYLYVNTPEGAMQISIKTGNKKKFGNGEVIGAGGKFIYYQSKDNKVGSMIVYKINMVDGSQRNLFQDTIIEVKEIEKGVFYFRGESGNEYVNPLNDNDGYFYHEWLGEDVTEATE